MSAATLQLRWTKHGGGQRVRNGVTKVLRGASWKSGWVIVAHNDRLMPYPTGGFDSAVTIANGGPLNIAGADANGGLRVIAKLPKVRLTVTRGGGSNSLTILYSSGTNVDVLIVLTNTATAQDAHILIRSNADAMRYLDCNYTGNGGGVAGAQSVVDVPHVRLYGISQSEVQNSDASNDLDFVEGDQAEVCEYGMFKISSTAVLSVPAKGFLSDNQTVQPLAAPLLLPVHVVGYDEDDRAICNF